MWSGLAKSILVLTSFAPLLLVIAINFFFHDDKTLCGDDKTLWVSVFLGVVAIVLILTCWMMMKFALNKGETYKLHIKEFNRRDHGIHTFLVIYLLPIMRSPDLLFTANWQTVICAVGVLCIVIVTMVQIGAYNFNPVMCLCGYRFYEVKDKEDVHHLLISRTDLLRPGREVQIRRISHDVYVKTESVNA